MAKKPNSKKVNAAIEKFCLLTEVDTLAFFSCLDVNWLIQINVIVAIAINNYMQAVNHTDKH